MTEMETHTKVEWDSSSSQVLLNPKIPAEIRSVLVGLPGQLKDLEGHVFLTTSGTTSGEIKLVALSKRAILCSAQAVNSWISADRSDVWFQVLPEFHIGGLAVHARSYLSGSSIKEFIGRWNPLEFSHQIEGCTLGSLVPTQIYDLVEKELSAASSLKAVFVGGGARSPALYKEARRLGWPLLPTYGCSEASSQVATADMNSLESEEFPHLKKLPHIDVENRDGKLALKGNSLLSGYVYIGDGEFRWENPLQRGWFLSEDRGGVVGEIVTCRGRSNLVFKVNGENVDLNALNLKLDDAKRITKFAGDAILYSRPDERRGNELVLISDSKDDIESLVDQFNQKVLPFERVLERVYVHKVHRTPLGKPIYHLLEKELLRN